MLELEVVPGPLGLVCGDGRARTSGIRGVGEGVVRAHAGANTFPSGKNKKTQQTATGSAHSTSTVLGFFFLLRKFLYAFFFLV